MILVCLEDFQETRSSQVVQCDCLEFRSGNHKHIEAAHSDWIQNFAGSYGLLLHGMESFMLIAARSQQKTRCQETEAEAASITCEPAAVECTSGLELACPAAAHAGHAGLSL